MVFSVWMTLSAQKKRAITLIAFFAELLQVWVTFQENVLNYLSNALLLPLVIRSNRVIAKYFVSYETTVSEMKFTGNN